MEIMMEKRVLINEKFVIKKNYILRLELYIILIKFNNNLFKLIFI